MYQHRPVVSVRDGIKANIGIKDVCCCKRGASNATTNDGAPEPMPRDNGAVSTSEQPWAANMEQREAALRGYAMPGRGRARRRDAARLGFANSFKDILGGKRHYNTVDPALWLWE